MSTFKVFTNTLAQIGGKLSTALISIFLIKILTNYLDVEGYGVYSKIYNYLSIFSVIADLGLYAMSVREISKYRNDPKMMEKIAGCIMTLRAGFGVGIIFLSVLVAFFLPGYNTFSNLLCVGIVGVFTLFGLLNSSLLSGLQANLRTEFSFVSTTVWKISSFLLVCALAWWIWPKSQFGTSILWLEWQEIGLIGIFITGLIGNIIMTGMLYVYSKRVLTMRFHWDPVYIRSLLIQTLPYWLALFLNAIFFKVDVILLSIMQSGVTNTISISGVFASLEGSLVLSDKIVAVYSLPMKIVEVGMLFGTVFLNSLLPVLTENKDDPTKLTRIARKSLRVLLYFWLGIACFLYLRSAELLTLIANRSYLEPIMGNSAADVLSVVGAIFLFFFISSLFTYILVATEKQARLLWVNVAIALLNLVWNLLVIPVYGFMGSAYVTVACQALLVMIMYRVSKDKVQVFPEWKFAVLVCLWAGISLWVHALLSPFTINIVTSLSQSLGWSQSLEVLLNLIATGIVFWGSYLLMGGLLWKWFREVNDK
jgi:O-antigen/teichoic acid export membrane protein